MEEGSGPILYMMGWLCLALWAARMRFTCREKREGSSLLLAQVTSAPLTSTFIKHTRRLAVQPASGRCPAVMKLPPRHKQQQRPVGALASRKAAQARSMRAHLSANEPRLDCDGAAVAVHGVVAEVAAHMADLEEHAIGERL